MRNGELYMLLRTGTNFLYESRSHDNGVTWTVPRPSPLVSHNTPAALWRLEDHPDEIAAIWNHSPLTRYPLSVAISATAVRLGARRETSLHPTGPRCRIRTSLRQRTALCWQSGRRSERKAGVTSVGLDSRVNGYWASDTRPGRFPTSGLARGSKHRCTLAFGGTLSFPVLVARGRRPGPTLVVSANVHGDEYEGVRAILETFEWLDPEAMSGDLLAVPVLNVPAFWSGTRTVRWTMRIWRVCFPETRTERRRSKSRGTSRTA